MTSRAGWTFVVFVFLLCACADEGDTFKRYFIKYYGTDGDHEAADMVVNADGTIVLIGTAEFPANSGNTKVYVAKTTPSGQVIWDMTFGNGTDHAQDIEPISTGYVILVNTVVGIDQTQFKLIRIGDDGDKLNSDSLVYDVLADQTGKSVTPLSDGGFFVAGNTLDSDSITTGDAALPVPERFDLLYVRFDNTFLTANSVEDRIPSSTIGAAIKIYETTPGAFMTSEYSNQLTTGEQANANNYEANFIFRNFTFDPGSTSGQLLTIGDNSKAEFLNQTVSIGDGKFYSIGTSVGLSSNILITKTISTPTGPAKVFENSFGSEIEGVSIFPTGQSCYVLANTINQSDGTRDIWLTKVNSFTGDQEAGWIKGVTIGSDTNDDTGKVVSVAPNGDIIILGTMTLTNQRKITIIKLSKDGKYTP
jgi:hypothetical protein